MTAVAPMPDQRPAAVAVYRDDGPIARALGALAARTGRVHDPLLVAVAAAALLALVAVARDDASTALAGTACAGVVLFGGLAAGGRATPRLLWTQIPLLRLIEYAALLWLAALAGPDAAPAAFALLAVLAFRHYDLVYRLKLRGATTPAWLNVLAGGWDGRLVAAFVLLAAGALPTGYYVAASVLGAVFVCEAVVGWIFFLRQAEWPLEFDDDDEDGDDDG